MFKKPLFFTTIFISLILGTLLSAKADFKNNSGLIEILEDEKGISPGQACVFYSKDNHGDKLLGGGWIAS